MKTDDDRVAKGFTLKDLLLAITFSLIPVVHLFMIFTGLIFAILDIMYKSDKISLFKAKKRYTQVEVDKLLWQINEMQPLKEVARSIPDCMVDSESSLPDSQKLASKLKYDDFV